MSSKRAAPAAAAADAPAKKRSTKLNTDNVPHAARQAHKAKSIEKIEMPKRPKTAWSIFFMEYLDKQRAAGKNVAPTAEGANAAKVWKEMTDEQKAPYSEQYQRELASYKERTEKKLQEMTPAEFRQENMRRQALKKAGKKTLPLLKDPNAPKRPLGAYFRFAHDQRATGKYNHLGVKEQAKALGEAWAAAPDSVKTPYQEAFKKESEQYKVLKAAYDEEAKTFQP
ncbi:exp1-like protein [Actinomortierella ambigua]|nr:exp1-like protein [Actinomortierella ambigua]